MSNLKPQLINRGKQDFVLGWKPLPYAQARSYKLYRSSTEAGVYTLFRSDIGSTVSKTHKGLIAAYIKDNEIPLIGITNIFFKLTAVDAKNVETPIADSAPTKVDMDGVSTLYEGENGDRNSHGFGWDETNRRWMKLASSPEGYLKVDIGGATINATISGVKIAALADDTTEKYLLVTADRKLVVTVPDEVDVNIDHSISTYQPTTSVIKSAQDVSVIPSTETLVLSHTAIADFKLVTVSASGTADAMYRLYVDGAFIAKKRTSWTVRNIDFGFGDHGMDITNGELIEITAEHTEAQDQMFDSNIFGYAPIII